MLGILLKPQIKIDLYLICEEVFILIKNMKLIMFLILSQIIDQYGRLLGILKVIGGMIDMDDINVIGYIMQMV